MLKQLIAEKWLTANGVVGFWPANSVGDDIELYTDDTRTKRLATLHTIRQQMAREQGKPNLALADFIAPKESGIADYIGGFAVTAGIGEEDVARRFERANDDYSKIMVKALADRLAEAFAEALHAKVRRELWAYAPDETLTNDELIGEAYTGIRPAPGYPAQPDHTEKRTLFELLKAEQATGLKLTESYAMWPAAAVSGFYFAHPELPLFRRRQDRPRPGRRLRQAQGLEPRGGRALAGADPQLRSQAHGRGRGLADGQDLSRHGERVFPGGSGAQSRVVQNADEAFIQRRKRNQAVRLIEDRRLHQV